MSQQAPPSPLQQLTWEQKKSFVAGLAKLGAMPLVVVMRQRAGFRYLGSWQMAVTAALMFGIGQGAGGNGLHAILSLIPFVNPGPVPAVSLGGTLLSLYAVVYLVWGLVQRRQRWNEIMGCWLKVPGFVAWHSQFPGISRLARVLPMVDDNALWRWVEPSVAFAVGLLISPLLNPLGGWIMFSAACLFVLEAVLYEQRLQYRLALHDRTVEALGMRDDFRPRPASQKRKALPRVVPTGLGDGGNP